MTEPRGIYAPWRELTPQAKECAIAELEELTDYPQVGDAVMLMTACTHDPSMIPPTIHALRRRLGIT